MSQDMPKLNIPNADFSPPIWSEEQLTQILGCIDCGNATGKRDYAMLLLVARLGIRDADLQNLKLSDVNWETKSIEFIQLKTKQSLTLPLLEDVGWAIIEYLKNGRPKTMCQNIFVKHIHPYGEMALCFYNLKKYINSAGITVNSDKSKGIHALRHTLVNRLLEKNVPTDTISTILGHTSDNSIKNYLHTDLKTLKLCALEVSEVTVNE